jgi:hypothetical protein
VANLYLDNDVSYRIAPLLRAAGHRVTTTPNLGLSRATDDAQLLTSARNGWTFVTYNRTDFTMLHAAWLNWPAAFGFAFPPHSGIPVLDPAIPGVLFQVVADFLATTPPELLINGLFWWHHRDGWRRRTISGGWKPLP